MADAEIIKDNINSKTVEENTNMKAEQSSGDSNSSSFSQVENTSKQNDSGSSAAENETNDPIRKNAFKLQPSALGSKLSLKSSILKPSQLSSTPADGPKSVILAPSKLKIESEGKEQDNNTSKNVLPVVAEAPKFVPLEINSGASISNSATSTAPKVVVAPSSNFIFGQNLHERVAGDINKDVSKAAETTSEASNTNGNVEMIFTSTVQKEICAESKESKENKSLSESAREFLESRTNKRKYEEVAVITGEEDEVNILQLNCKLFAFDKKAGNWQERGRGTLRLNDKLVSSEKGDYHQSRLVIRASGSLRVVLNTKIWAGMTVDQASEKSIRLTAMDNNGEIKVFLIMASSEEIKQLVRSLKFRVGNAVIRQIQEGNEENRDTSNV